MFTSSQFSEMSNYDWKLAMADCYTVILNSGVYIVFCKRYFVDAFMCMYATEMSDKVSHKMISALLAMSLSYYFVMGEHVEKEMRRTDEILSTLLGWSSDESYTNVTEDRKGRVILNTYWDTYYTDYLYT